MGFCQSSSSTSVINQTAPVNPHSEEQDCVRWEIQQSKYFEVLDLKRSPFDKSQVERKYRKKFAQASTKNDTNKMVQLNKAKNCLEDDDLRNKYIAQCDRFGVKDGC